MTDDVPTNPYGATEVAPPRFDTIKVPESRPETNPRPEAWNPGAPDYPWWRVCVKPKPEPTGERMAQVFLLAYIQELVRRNAEDWLTLEQDRADLERQLTNLRRQSNARG